MAQDCTLAGESVCDNGLYSSYLTHLELGAANYGPDGHTKTSQDKTVFHEFREVSSKPNYRDTLNAVEDMEYVPMLQHHSLFSTVDQLVRDNDGKVIFFVNDLFPEYVDDAVTKVKQYLKAKHDLHGYGNVIVESIVGNYSVMNMTEPLAKYGRVAYDSVHLKNPEVSFYNYGIDGDEMLYDDESRAKAREKLRMLANFSCDGLFFFPIDPRNNFIPKIEYDEYINNHILYQETQEWQAMRYVFPEGVVMDKGYGAVYFIKSNMTDARCKKR